MFVLSNFAEKLEELMFDNQTSPTQLAEALGVPKTTVYRYLKKAHAPKLDILVKIANIFECTTDYLLGLEAENSATHFNTQLPLFRERFPLLLKENEVTKYRLCKDLEFTESEVYFWQNGKRSPSVESVVLLAEYLGCSVDFVLGREL